MKKGLNPATKKVATINCDQIKVKDKSLELTVKDDKTFSIVNEIVFIISGKKHTFRRFNENICKTCGFDKTLPREPMIFNESIMSLAEYFEGQCEECGSQKDGSTIIKEKTGCQEDL